MAGLVALCCAAHGWALDANRNLSQEIRKSWQIENGFPGGAVSAFAQTEDGYLWIGTDKGLIRFNGSDFQTFEQLNPSSVQINSVLKLVADPDGDLWILLYNTELLHFKDGRIDLVRGDMHAPTGITALGREANGAMLLSSLVTGTLVFKRGQFLPAGSADGKSVPRATSSVSDNEYAPGQKWPTGLGPHTLSAPRSAVTSLTGTADGTIWLGTADRGLFRLKNGQVSAVSDFGGARVNCLLAGEGMDLWIGTSKGLVQWDGTKLTRANVPRSLINSDVLSLLRDRDSNIWVGTMTAVKRFNSRHFPLETEEMPSSGPEATALFEDREGDIWIGSRKGIERVRDSTFLDYSTPALGSHRTGPVYVDDEGCVWVAPLEGGRQWSKGGESGVVKIAGLDRDVVYSITGRGNELWVGRQHGGLTHLSNIHGSLTS